ncbi:hypothetical protein FH972_006745 [Carpinus fangiana]|uniref:Proteasome alpha-type subunits domain-containing protein n=1 Tax=Carpinus fangiana TaxID=176857 RepID=A0A5N6QT82_9ROSI|nr:hypothetical protein FH972_006745 [Carpinus fangiana]
MARAKVTFDNLELANTPLCLDKSRRYSETKLLEFGFRRDKSMFSSAWKAYPKLSSDWSERKNVFQSCVETVLQSNPIVAVFGKNVIVVAFEKKSIEDPGLTNLERTPAMLAFAGEEEDSFLLAWRVQVEIEEHQRIRGFPTPMSPEYVALKVANAKKLTCKFHRVPYALFTLIVGFDPYTWQPGLFATDPGGRVGKFGAYAIGRDLDLMNKFLRNNYQEEISVEVAVALAAAALLKVGEIKKKNIEVALITEPNKRWQLEQAMIDAICAKVKTIKAASKGPTHHEQKNAEKAAEERQKAEKAAAKKERRKAKKAAAQAARNALSDKLLIDVTVPDKKDIPEEPQVDEIEIWEKKSYRKLDRRWRYMHKKRVKKAAAESAKKKAPPDKPMVHVAVADQMALSEETQVDEIEMWEEKEAAKKKAPQDEPLDDVAVADDQVLALPEAQVDEIEIKEERATCEAFPFGKFVIMERELFVEMIEERAREIERG